jgi:ATP-binding cassette subfamily F protein uup
VPIGRLSGGERRRLYLLSVLMEAPNVLLLDEPTNDLDVMTLSILEDYLQTFPGPILTVSHDRFLLDKLADTIFEVVGDGSVAVYTGNWSEWNAKRRDAEAPPKAEKPKMQQERPREKKLKFSFKEEREFATIDDDIAALEAKIEENQAAQGAAGSDYVKLQQLQEELSELEAALEYKTERWMYLTELKEKIDAQTK